MLLCPCTHTQAPVPVLWPCELQNEKQHVRETGSGRHYDVRRSHSFHCVLFSACHRSEMDSIQPPTLCVQQAQDAGGSSGI